MVKGLNMLNLILDRELHMLQPRSRLFGDAYLNESKLFESTGSMTSLAKFDSFRFILGQVTQSALLS